MGNKWSYDDFKHDDFTYEDYKEGEDFTYDDYEAPDKFEYNDFSHEDYAESDAVKGASSDLNSHLANKPGAYQSQWQGQLDNLMNSIMNREKFSYDLNGDALYQQYKDKYIQQGKLAMGDAIGQASAMTGGYGNSYAQSVGQQQYQASLDNLNDIVPQLYQMALDKYNQEGQDLYNKYGMVMDRENLDYGRHRDTVSDWNVDRDYLTGRYDSERGFDYSKYVDDRNFAYGKYSDDRNLAYSQYESDRAFGYDQYVNDRNFAYGKWADDRTFDYTKYSADRSLAYDKYSSDRSLAYDEYATDKNLSYDEYRNAIADEQWEKSYKLSERELKLKEDAQKNNTVDDSGDDDFVGPPKAPTKVPSIQVPQGEDAPIAATKSTDTFIATHATQYEYVGRNKTLAQFKDYMKKEIDKATNLSDAEVEYLVRHYGLA